MTKKSPPKTLSAPWWAVNVPESERDYTCTRCGHTVQLEYDSEWLGPDDNYHWNLCNACAQELVLEMWEKLDAVANIVTTDHETKEAFISRVRAVLGANVPQSDSSAPSGRVHPLVGPCCHFCGEDAGHTLGTCPACQDVEPTEKALLRCRKLLRECLSHLDGEFLAATCSDLHERICAELHWPNVKEQRPAAKKD